MTKIFPAIILFSLIFLTNCATPPGKLSEKDFVRQDVSLSIPLDQAIRNFHAGFRFCGAESGGPIFVTHHGVAECMPPEANGTELCDIYVGRGEGGRSDLVLGKVEIS